jgi:hypothetical protein
LSQVILAEFERRRTADALDALTEFCRWLKYLNPPAWIPVIERLPPKDTEVLTFDGDYSGGFLVAALESDGSWFSPGGDYAEPSHWMPLPEPPKP